MLPVDQLRHGAHGAAVTEANKIERARIRGALVIVASSNEELRIAIPIEVLPECMASTHGRCRC